MKQVFSHNIKDIFKAFCKERHAEDKGRNFDLLQEVYANTELFDLSFLPLITTEEIEYFFGDRSDAHIETENGKEIYTIPLIDLQDFALPFESVFCKTREGEDSVHVFMREYSPNLITGTIISHSLKGSIRLTSPFQIDLRIGEIKIDTTSLLKYTHSLMDFFNEDQSKYGKIIEVALYTIIGDILFTFKTLCRLPKHSVVADTPKHSDYYTRKHGSTIKVCKPIYYIMNKDEEKEKRNYKRIKPVGHLAFDHSFKVRGHWRRISPHTYGKDRSGAYTVTTGFTWVREHVRGEGDLIKKIRVVK